MSAAPFVQPPAPILDPDIVGALEDGESIDRADRERFVPPAYRGPAPDAVIDSEDDGDPDLDLDLDLDPVTDEADA